MCFQIVPLIFLSSVVIEAGENSLFCCAPERDRIGDMQERNYKTRRFNNIYRMD